MKARLLRFFVQVANAFWLVPGLIAVALAGLGLLVVRVQALDLLPSWLPDSWVYGGGDTGARTLLGAIASSTIAVAGTLFSITIAALTLASSQMGPRLLGNFMRDRGNQTTLGVLLGTFGYALVVLRSVRGGEEEAFVPTLGVTVGLALAGGCIALMIYFVHHVASRINVGTVIDLVHDDVVRQLRRVTSETPPRPQDDPVDWNAADTVRVRGSGYLQQVDVAALVNWADEHDCVVTLLKRPGEFVLQGAPLALVSRAPDRAEEALWSRIALSRQAGSPADLIFPIEQLVEVAVRALSPGVNDPRTAIAVLDRLGALLAWLADRHIDDGVRECGGVVRLRLRPLAYEHITDAMFDMIREHVGGSPSVLLHLVGLLTEVARVERDPARLEALRAKARDAHAQGQAMFENAHDREALAAAWSSFLSVSADDASKPGPRREPGATPRLPRA
jgi:uncharacterized membrane protein